jgi:hypothetical protein
MLRLLELLSGPLMTQISSIIRVEESSKAKKEHQYSPHPSNPFKTISTKPVCRSITNKLVVCFRKHRSSFDMRLQVKRTCDDYVTVARKVKLPVTLPSNLNYYHNVSACLGIVFTRTLNMHEDFIIISSLLRPSCTVYLQHSPG